MHPKTLFSNDEVVLAKLISKWISDLLDARSNGIPVERAESLEVARQCLSDAFSLADLGAASNADAVALLPSLPSIVDAYRATHAAAASRPIDELAAEAHKAAGNGHMAAQNYTAAYDAYTEAIACNPQNAIYHANRAAAALEMGRTQEALDDSRRAVSLDASYAKAYSRLGGALFALQRYEEALEAYERLLELDPANEVAISRLREIKKLLAPAAPSTPSSDAAAASSSGQNPMASLLNNPQLAQLLSNPQIANMARQFMGNSAGGDSDNSANGGGFDMAALMNNPMLRQM